MKTYLILLLPLLLIFFSVNCTNLNHNPEEFKKEFKKNNLKLLALKSKSQLSRLLYNQFNRCFQKNTFAEPGFKTEITYNPILVKMKTSNIELQVKRNLVVQGTFGKPIIGNSFEAIAEISSPNNSGTSNLKAICREKYVCRAIELWSQDKSRGCPSKE